MSAFPSSILDPFTSSLNAPYAVISNKASTPSYFATNPTTLLSTSQPTSFTISTGASIYTQHAPTLLSARQSLTIVTCFWSPSGSLNAINSILCKLSSRCLSSNSGEKLRVRICFSSLSLTQKAFHSRSSKGKDWPESTWVPKLGLPEPSVLRGLDLKIKSIFRLPFSVMHPKFIIIDRKIVLLPSCNVSWEEWLEGCIKLEGDVVQQFVRFHDAFWVDGSDREGEGISPASRSSNRSTHDGTPLPKSGSAPQDATVLSTIISETQHSADSILGSTPSIFLPSPHHSYPHPFASPPPSPLNTFLLTAIANATSSITIATPNLTCRTVICALLARLSHGVNVTIYTSRRMMIVEQLVTAGTITELCVWGIRRKYRKMLKRSKESAGSRQADDPETQPSLGKLQVFYFDPSPSTTSTSTSGPKCFADKLHFKSTIIDNQIVVLGSGNMDRASWYTSQELGVAFASRELATQVQHEFQAYLTKPNGGGRYVTQVI